MQNSLKTIRICGMYVIATSLFNGMILGETVRSSNPALEIQGPVTLTAADREDEFPSIGCAADGQIWVTWVSYDGQRDRVMVRPRDGDTPPVPLSPTAKDCWRTAMQQDGQGRLWVTWAQNEGGNWDIWSSYLEGNQWCKPIRLTRNPENDLCQQLARDTSGRLWMVWQAVQEHNYEIQLAQVTPQGLLDQRNVSRHPASDWEPAICADRQGGIVIGWDSYRHGSYDIFLCQVSNGGDLSDPQLVAGGPTYEAHVSVAVDAENRTWIAWDDGGKYWGQHGVPRLRLHGRRSVHLRCLASGQLWKTEQDLSTVLRGPFAKFSELPRLRLDGNGRLWLFVRHLEDLTPPGKRKVGGQLRAHQPRGIWNPYALCYANGQWSDPVLIPLSNGRNDMRFATCLDSEGQIHAAWTDDQRKPRRAEEPGNHEVRATRIRCESSGTIALPVVAAEPHLPTPTVIPDARANRPQYRLETPDGGFTLRFGDTHRHTDISRCGMNVDGSLMDTYRYAIDAAGLDFLGISDHDQDILKHRYGRAEQGPLQDYAWWRSQKYCDLFHIPGVFLPLYGYEHGGSYNARGGHKNVLYTQRGFPCYEDDAPNALFRQLQGKNAVVIPHQLADGGSATDWGKWDPQFERVAEIFQARGSYEFFGAPLMAKVKREGFYLQDALEGGVRIGVIASSDHGLVHGAYAGVYAREFTREGILEALRSRRSFGATEQMILDLRIGECLLGGETDVNQAPAFHATARGVQPLELVEIVRNGKIVYSTTPNEKACSFQFSDTDLKAGASAFYYLRVKQQNGDWAWSSAIWVHRQ